MTRPIAAELLLLALDTRSGRPIVDSARLAPALTAAAIVELVLDGSLEIAQERGGPVARGRFVRAAAPQPEVPVLEEIAAACEGKRPKKAVSSIAVYTFKGTAARLRTWLTDGLVAEGAVTRRERRVLGLVPRTTFPQADPIIEAEVRERVWQVLGLGRDPDPRTATLVSLVAALDLAPKLFRGADKRALRARAEQIRKTEWAGSVVKELIEEMWVAVSATIITPTIIASS